MVDTPDSKLIQKIKKENPDLPFEDILKSDHRRISDPQIR